MDVHIKAQDAGATLKHELQQRQWGSMANMTDPFGNDFDLIEFAPGGYERLVNVP